MAGMRNHRAADVLDVHGGLVEQVGCQCIGRALTRTPSDGWAHLGSTFPIATAAAIGVGVAGAALAGDPGRLARRLRRGPARSREGREPIGLPFRTRVFRGFAGAGRHSRASREPSGSLAATPVGSREGCEGALRGPAKDANPLVFPAQPACFVASRARVAIRALRESPRARITVRVLREPSSVAPRPAG